MNGTKRNAWNRRNRRSPRFLSTIAAAMPTSASAAVGAMRPGCAAEDLSARISWSMPRSIPERYWNRVKTPMAPARLASSLLAVAKVGGPSAATNTIARLPSRRPIAVFGFMLGAPGKPDFRISRSSSQPASTHRLSVAMLHPMIRAVSRQRLTVRPRTLELDSNMSGSPSNRKPASPGNRFRPSPQPLLRIV